MSAEPAPHGDAGLVRRVRLRLLAWSGGTTLAVLIVLGTLLYATVSNALANAGVDQLKRRADLVSLAVGRVPDRFTQPLTGRDEIISSLPDSPGIQFGGPFSGTIAYIVSPGGAVFPGALTELSPVLRTFTAPANPPPEAETIENTTLGTTPIRVLTRPVERPEGTFVVTVVGDRTAEQQALVVLLTVLLAGGLVALAAALGVGWLYAERALVPIRDALRRQREFAADASHELRTPLAIVRGSVDHLRRNADTPARDVGTALDDLDAEVDRLGSLVDDLLLLARTDSGELELSRLPLDLADVAVDAAGGLAPLGEARAVRVEVDAEPAEVEGDAGRLRQLVRILVDNAIRHAPPDTTVRVHVRSSGADAVLAVEDDGPGIRVEDLPRIFDRFWRAAGAPPGGTGLGLTIAAWIAERHDGRIRAMNRLEGGARFEVRLPRA